MNKISLFFALVACCFSLQLAAQKTAVFNEGNLAYKRGEDFFEKGVYGYALTEYKNAIDILAPANEPEWVLLRMRAELGYAKSAVRMDMPDGEKLILDFIRKYKPDPLASLALVEVANYFFNAGKYDKAIEFYKQINPRELPNSQRAEVYFKTGYSYFVQKNFKDAEANFREIKDVQSEYFYPTNYYYGLCKFFSADYAEAVKAFRLVERSKDYKPLVPYYITQIYFAQRDFDEVIKYAEPKLSDRTLRNSKEMNQLVGQSYFEKGDYKSALPFLEKYAESSGKMREEEFYQLAYTQYQVGKFKNAADNFEELTSLNSPLGQNALYYLGDSKLKLKDRSGARNAFAAASKMNYDKDIQENSLINYAKLSYELHFDRDALSALQEIKSSSKFYSDAQVLMSEIFVNTRNYDQAITTLEAMPNKTPALKEAYQKVLYLRGVQHHKDGRLPLAKDLFKKALDNSVNNEYKALTLYWLGDIANTDGQYDQSINHLNQFMALSKAITTLPEESSVFTANYLQGYNYLKKGNYTTAKDYFQDAVSGIKRNRNFIKNKAIKDGVLGDATLRAGDCFFKGNKYNDAIKFYNEAVSARYPGFEYALFQKAIIEGLRGNNTDKIIALEQLVSDYPKSSFADDAIFQLGITYQQIKQLSKATDALKRLVNTYPNSELVNSALLRLGLIAYAQGNPRGAIEYYKQVFSHTPTKQEGTAALSSLREIYINDLGDPNGYSDFLATLPDSYKSENDSRDVLAFEAGESAFGKGDYARAVTAYTDYINKYPNGADILIARYRRGESYAALKKYKEALGDYEFVVSKGQGRFYVDAVANAAKISYNSEQNFQKAYDYYTKWETVAATAEDRFEAQLGAMRSAYRTGDVTAVQTAARKVANNSAASNDQVATAHFYLGKIAYDKKDWTGAMSSFQQVIKMSDDEQTAEARYLVADIYYQQRNLDKAKTQCLANNNESSGYPYWVGKSLLLLSDVFAEQGDTFSAKTVLEALIENYENSTDDIIPTAKKKLDVLNKQSAGSSRLEKAGDNKFMDDGN